MKPICVIAGTKAQYEWWLRDNAMTPQEAIYCPTPEHVRGLEFSRIEKVGTWYANRACLAAAVEAEPHVR